MLYTNRVKNNIVFVYWITEQLIYIYWYSIVSFKGHKEPYSHTQ